MFNIVYDPIPIVIKIIFQCKYAPPLLLLVGDLLGDCFYVFILFSYYYDERKQTNTCK